MTITIFVHENGKTTVSKSYHSAASNAERRHRKAFIRAIGGDIVARWTVKFK